MERKAKKVCESEAEHVQLVMANHLNGNGRLFGGQLTEWIDVLQGLLLDAIVIVILLPLLLIV